MNLPSRRQTGASPPDNLDHSQLLANVKTLSSPEFEGRKTGTAGNKKAQGYVLKRFQDLKLQPLKGSYQQNFSFVPIMIRS